MPIERSDAEQVANAYRTALSEGDKTLGRSLEQRILLAVVNESADKTATWLETRVENGGELARPIRDFNQSASRADLVGRAVAAVTSRLFSEAQSAVVSLTFSSTAPLWLASLLGYIGGFFGFAEAFGASIGFGVASALAAGWAGRLAYLAVRAAQIAAQTDPGAQVIATIQSAQSIGASAMRIFQSHAAPAVQRLYALANTAPASSTILTKLRGAAVTIVVAAWVSAGVAVIVFGLGFAKGWTAYQDLNATTPLIRP